MKRRAAFILEDQGAPRNAASRTRGFGASGRGFCAALVVMLAVNGAAGQVLDAGSAPPATPPVASSSFLSGLNWYDLPVKPFVQETVTYSDNVYGLANGGALPPGAQSRGDFSYFTQVGASSKIYISGQQFFIDGNYGISRYVTNTPLNASQYGMDAGVNWTLGSRCTGTVTASDSVQAGVLDQQVGLGVNLVTSKALSGNGKCLLIDGFSLLANAGATQTVNSQALDQLNDGNNLTYAFGFSHELASVDKFQALYTYTLTNYTGRSFAIGTGLAGQVVTRDITASYMHYLLVDVDATIAAGFSQLSLTPIGGGAQTSYLAPHYAFTLEWKPSPKTTFSGSVSHTVGAPTSVVGNTQVTDSLQFAAAYAYTPKVSFNAGFGMGTASGSTTLLPGVPAAASAAQKFMSASAGVTYQVTPFVNSSATYRYYDRTQAGVATTESLVLLGINYSPY